MNIIDRRKNPREKSLNNRQRFITRSRDHIKKVVKDAIHEGKISDVGDGNVKVPVGGTSEPTFHHDRKTGQHRSVAPGNREFVENDQLRKPEGGGGEGGSKPTNAADISEDDFEFTLTQDEFLSFFFDDLELPDLVKKQMIDMKRLVAKRAGYTNNGNPCQLDIRRTMKMSLGRRIGLHRPSEEEIADLEQQMALAKQTDAMHRFADLELELAQARRRLKAIPWLDPVDVRYRHFEMRPQPATKAVMFCCMDVSGSMTEREKDLAKRFFMLLYMFLHRKYENVDVVFVRHHTQASEVTEEQFFRDRETGGTIVSSALKLMLAIIRQRYPTNEWNIYVAQASDGDNYANDSDECVATMDDLLPLCQYFAYLDIARDPTSGWYGSVQESELWKTYKAMQRAHPNLALRQVTQQNQIWSVFRDLFTKDRQRQH